MMMMMMICLYASAHPLCHRNTSFREFLSPPLRVTFRYTVKDLSYLQRQFRSLEHDQVVRLRSVTFLCDEPRLISVVETSFNQ
jgi:hypothetical protein